MFQWRTSTETTKLEKARDDALTVLDSLDPIDPDYTKTMTHIETLSNLIAAERRELVSPNTVIMALANIGGILAIVKYEQVNIVTSKAIAFVGKTLR